ncbi:MAG TPA: double-strand break repair helicase AddA [Xanthobacteraceae bacterium]|nr:double-strand break repair helicase AddA [Xanthobacteraceae bacterium]
MTDAGDIPGEVIERQNVASDPAVSAWVSANAGSGKTHVLTQRVIRLLLDGVDPAKILCLTFTKAAAANMATRVFDTLAAWTALDDAELDRKIFEMEGRRPSAARRLRARRLFAEALETPGGLKVQTIHAFCTALLHQFPFEADVAASFEVMEERASAELIDRLRLEVLQEAAEKPDTPLGQALTAAIVAAADVTFADVVREAIAARDVLSAWIEEAGGVQAAIGDLSRRLGIAPEETPEDIEAQFFASPHLPPAEWPGLIAVLQGGLKSDRDQAERLRTARTLSGAAAIDAYLDVFCKSDGEPRQSLMTQGLVKRHPQWVDRLQKEQIRVLALRERRRAVRLRERTAALATIAYEVLTRYRAEKNRAGLLDYEDLIDKTLTLLSREGSAAWVMYKLDLGIDHILIDEAQDTSRKQWEVIARLTSEFTAGAGARADVKRSIFAVGDEKQSIYSFQGAAPHRFAEMRRHFAARHEASGMHFRSVDFLYSFRSAPDVLEAVDAVFGRPEAFAGLTADPVKTVHQAVRTKAPGCVELWPLEAPDEKAEMEAWDTPFDFTSEESPRARLARRIAQTVKLWIARGDKVAMTGAPIRFGDILVLVRQRGPLFEAIIRALKDHGVEVAGADRLILTEHIAVMDLMSLGDALLLADDDLALAEVLKSPLFGVAEEQLFCLAHGRAGSLRAALRRRSGDDPVFAEASRRLDEWAEAARRDGPFAFYARLLGPEGGRRKMLARLGPEAADALDEFLAFALEYERRHTPSLQGFLGWLRATPPEVKRDMDIVRDEVRVMTVHGAKGLEAPVVILADTTTPPKGPRDPSLLALGKDGAAPALVWASNRQGDVPVVAEARAKAVRAAEDEHRRLLYVAMTRAADKLIVCGARGEKRPPDGCWYELVSEALLADARKVPAEIGAGTVFRWQKFAPAEPAAPAPTQASADSAAMPDWLAQPAPAAPARTAPLAPSTAFAEWRNEGAAFPGVGRETAEDAAFARQRGRLVHRLLQSLPELAPGIRAQAAQRFLARARPPLDPNRIEAILTETLRVMEHPEFAVLFGAGSRAETSIIGRLSRPDGIVQRVSGQIDRLAVTGDTVLLADFKTDRNPPACAEDVPEPYRVQLALYRAVLAQLYPGRTIRAALVFTEAPRLIELPPASLDAALAELARLDPAEPAT